MFQPVYEDALQIDTAAAPLLNDIQMVADRVQRATQSDIVPARTTCEGLESQVSRSDFREVYTNQIQGKITLKLLNLMTAFCFSNQVTELDFCSSNPI